MSDPTPSDYCKHGWHRPSGYCPQCRAEDDEWRVQLRIDRAVKDATQRTLDAVRDAVSSVRHWAEELRQHPQDADTAQAAVRALWLHADILDALLRREDRNEPATT